MAANSAAAGPGPGEFVRSRRPGVPGVAEVLRARFTRHAYPMHTHDTWTVLLVDEGAVDYGLERHRHAGDRSAVTVLPPHVAHDGRAATPEGFRKRVVYLEPDALPAAAAGFFAGAPALGDPRAWTAVSALHEAASRPGEEFEAAGRAALVVDALRSRAAGGPEPARHEDSPLARRLRELLDEHVVDGIALADAAALLGASTAHLVRAFGHHHGLPPHAYLTARRVDLARRLLLAGTRPAEAAARAGFHDQSHLTRHFRRVLGTTPARFAGVVRAGA
ncbi:AraC family transcriptional regulator [Kineococcus sp. SYSU DK004]|uniref:AraC family transcriptional regulator n=1 Tax=Kineococcus sp. SYSU DK004 TaxID=3383125 RepID=UPI003D7DE0E4